MKNFQWKSLLPHVIAVIVFAVVAVIYCKPVLDGKVLQQSDVIHWKGMAQDLFKYKETHGHYPLWNNNLFGGMPAYQIALEARNPIAVGYLHPLFMLFLPKPIGYFFLLCISFYFLSQVLRVNPWLGVLGGIAYAYATFSPIIVSAGHDTQMQAMGYMPALLAALWLIYTKRYWWGTALTALFSCLLIAQNHLQITYYFLIVAGCMTIGFAIQWIKQKDFKHLLLAGILAAVAGVIGAACNLVSLATTNDYSKATMRNGTLNLDTAKNASTTRTSSGLPIDYAFSWSYGKAETFTLLVPGIYGGSGGGELDENSHLAKTAIERGVPEDQAAQFASGMPTYWGKQPFTSGPVYLGAIVCLLFIFGTVYLNTPHKWWILAVCILAVLMSWGKNFETFNTFLFGYLPLYNKFRVPTMTLVIPQLLFPVIAILALQQFFFEEMNKVEALKKLKLTAYITGGFIAIAGLMYLSFNYVGANNDQYIKGLLGQVLRGDEPSVKTFYNAIIEDRQSLFGKDLLRSFIFISLALALLWLFIKDKIKAMYALSGILLLSSIDLFGVDRRYLNDKNYQDQETIDDEYFAPSPADAQILKDTSYYRVLNLTQDVFNDALTSYHFHSVGGYHPAKLSIVEDLLNFQLRKQPMNFQVLNMLNTKYIIVPDRKTNQPEVQTNPGALGPCWFVKGIDFVNGPAAAMKALDNFNPKDTAVVEDKFKSQVIVPGSIDSAATIKLIKNDNDFIKYKSNSKRNAFAVFSEIYYNRGWKVYIDGKESPIIQTNYVLRGLSVPSGDHTITFQFKPASYYNSTKIAVISSAFVWLLLLGAIAQEFKKRRQEA